MRKALRAAGVDDGETVRYAASSGFTVPERMILDRYRRRLWP